MNLKSWPDFATVYNRVELQKESLQSVVEVGMGNLAELEVEYQNKLLKGEKVDSISKKMIAVKADVKNAREELEMLKASGLSLSQLASSVLADFREFEQDVRVQVNTLWEAAEAEIAATKERIQALKEQAESLLEEHRIVRDEQYVPVIDHLDINEGNKHGMKFNASVPIAALERWPGI